jgi:hypothetical protein
MLFLLNISVTLVLSVCYQLLPLMRTHFVQGVYKTLGQTFGVTSRNQIMEKVTTTVCSQTVYEVQPATCLP